MGFGADAKGTHHGPGTPLPGFRSITEDSRGMAADREGDAGGTGPLPGERLWKSALLGSEAQGTLAA